MSASESTPQSPINERAILSQMVRDDAFRRQALGDGICGDHFYRYRPLYDAVMGMAKEGIPIDSGTLSARLEADGTIEDVGGHVLVGDLFAEVNDGRNWRHWIVGLRRSFADRVRADGLQLAGMARTPEQAMAAMEDARQAMKAALAGPSRSKTSREVMRELTDELGRLAAAGPIPGIPTGIEELDILSGGMRPGQLWSILGQTSRGKSVLLAQLGSCAVKQPGGKLAIFSAEMMAYEVGARLVSHRGGIDMQCLMNPGKTGKFNLQRIKTQIQLLAEECFFVDDTPSMSLAHVEREATRLADANNGLSAVVVDYVQILRTERARNQNREEVVAQISSTLKQLAKALCCPVITAAQMNQQGRSRESEAIAFDSDVMLAIVEDGIKVMKLRNGKRDELLPFRLNGETQTFVRFQPEPQPDEVADKQADKWSSDQARRKGRG